MDGRLRTADRGRWASRAAAGPRPAGRRDGQRWSERRPGRGRRGVRAGRVPTREAVVVGVPDPEWGTVVVGRRLRRAPTTWRTSATVAGARCPATPPRGCTCGCRACPERPAASPTGRRRADIADRVANADPTCRGPTAAQWLAGARPRTLPAAVAPVLAGSGVAAFDGGFALGRGGAGAGGRAWRCRSASTTPTTTPTASAAPTPTGSARSGWSARAWLDRRRSGRGLRLLRASPPSPGWPWC